MNESPDPARTPPLPQRPSVRARRAGILEAAGAELAFGRRRRSQRAGLAAGAVLVVALSALAWLATPLARHEPERRADSIELAIDFRLLDGPIARTVSFERSTRPSANSTTNSTADGAAAPRGVDFAVSHAGRMLAVELLTDLETDDALAESGVCLRVLRSGERVLLVDCATGGPGVVR